jgi:gluconolactonase
MRRRFFLLATIGAVLAAILSRPAIADEKIPHIGPVGDVKTLRDDFEFTEGPAADGKGNLFFTDIPANKIYQLDAAGKFSVFLEPSNHCNGLMFNGAGKLLACEMDGRLIEIDIATKKVTALATEYDGKRFNAPNDLVIDRDGGVYFTDPHFRAPMPLPQDKVAVYYRDPAGKVTRLIDDLKAPNGVILSPDEKTLYVIPSLQKEMMTYPVLGPGKLGPGKLFCTLQQPAGDDNRGGDGLTVDVKGNLYITAPTGVEVHDPHGKLLGILKFPAQPANCTFGGKDNKTLYVTARKGLYAVEMEVAGHVFPAGREVKGEK